MMELQIQTQANIKAKTHNLYYTIYLHNDTEYSEREKWNLIRLKKIV